MKKHLYAIHILNKVIDFDRYQRKTQFIPLDSLTRATQRRINYLMDHYPTRSYIAMSGSLVTTIRKPL